MRVRARGRAHSRVVVSAPRGADGAAPHSGCCFIDEEEEEEKEDEERGSFIRSHHRSAMIDHRGGRADRLV